MAGKDPCPLNGPHPGECAAGTENLHHIILKLRRVVIRTSLMLHYRVSVAPSEEQRVKVGANQHGTCEAGGGWGYGFDNPLNVTKKLPN